MTTRRRLPPGVRKFNLKSGVRYELVIDLGPDPDLTR